MRDFSWKYFAMTGDVDAYMLFKEANTVFGQTTDEATLEEQLTAQDGEEI